MADVLAGGSEPPAEDPEATFARQATAAGIVLPRKRRWDPWTAAAIVVVLILVTAGLGEVTGWVNLRETPAGWSYQSQSCSGTSNVHAVGTVSAALGPAYTEWLDSVASSMAKTVGQCFDLDLATTSGDGYVPPLGATGSEFAATYALPSSSESHSIPYPLATIPVSLNAVAVIYNLPGVGSGVNLSAAALSGIYNGSVTTWNSPLIASTNPGVNLASAPALVPYHDVNTSASSAAFTGFLASANPSWAPRDGAGSPVVWPVGPGVSSDSAMVATVAATPGAIGYLEIFGTPPAGVGVANLEDRAGDFAGPSDVDTWVAAESVSNSSAVVTGNWSELSLASSPAVDSYPLAVFSYVALYTDLGIAFGGALSLTNASWLLGYVYWLTAEVSVAPLPPAYETAAVNVLNNETFDGTKIMNLENEQTEGSEGGETGEF